MGMLLTSTKMFPDEVDSLNKNPAGLFVHIEDLSGPTGIVPRLNFYDIIFSYVHGDYTTSAAREIIFINLARSSRGTAPNILVPLGFPSASRRTIALLSKRT